MMQVAFRFSIPPRLLLLLALVGSVGFILT